VAAIAAAWVLLGLAGLPADSVMRLGGNDVVSLGAVSELNTKAARIRRSMGGKSASPSDLGEFKRVVATHYQIELNATTASPAAPRARGRPSELASGAASAFSSRRGVRRMWRRSCTRKARGRSSRRQAPRP